MSVLTLREFAEAYRIQNPHDVVHEPAAIRRNWITIIPLFVGLIAANILSAFHTGPLIARSFRTVPYTAEYTLMFIVGVLAVEFTVFVTMFASWKKTNSRDKALRILVILLAVMVAIIANVDAAMENLNSTASDVASITAAGFVGVFAPLVNLSIAEVLRKLLDQSTDDQEQAVSMYHEALKDADTKMRTRYVNYLKRIGITDPTEIMRLSAGQTQVTETLPEPSIDKPQVIELQLPKDKPPTKAEILADTLELRGDAELSFREIEQRYDTNPATVSAAKKILRSRGLLK